MFLQFRLFDIKSNEPSQHCENVETWHMNSECDLANFVQNIDY